MKSSIATIDRVIPIALGLAIGAAGLYYQSRFGLIAIVPLGTATIGSYPLYSILGISTRPLEAKRSSS